jgi:hypothetical protein
MISLLRVWYRVGAQPMVPSMQEMAHMQADFPCRRRGSNPRPSDQKIAPGGESAAELAEQLSVGHGDEAPWLVVP